MAPSKNFPVPADDGQPSKAQPENKPAPSGVQPSLLDDGPVPVPFALTVRARRLVAPESLPALAVVDAAPAIVEEDPPKEDVVADPRRARARALRRAGTSARSIAMELNIAVDVVERWTIAVEPTKTHVQRQRASRHREEHALPAAFVTGRAAARSAWKRGQPAIGAAMIAGLAEVTPFATRLRGEPATVIGALQWLRDSQAVPDSSVRVQVLAAPSRSMDVVAHELAQRLQLPIDRVQARAWTEAPDEDAIEVTVRISDPRLSGTITGWREALLNDLSTNAAIPGVAVAG